MVCALAVTAKCIDPCCVFDERGSDIQLPTSSQNSTRHITRIDRASYSRQHSISACSVYPYCVGQAYSNLPRLESNLNIVLNSNPSSTSHPQMQRQGQTLKTSACMPGAEAGLRFLEGARKEPQWLQVLCQLREQDYCPHKSWSRSLQLAFTKLSAGQGAYSGLVQRARACFQFHRVRMWIVHCFASVRLLIKMRLFLKHVLMSHLEADLGQLVLSY